MKRKSCAVTLAVAIASASATGAADWTQDGFNPQRSGFTPDDPGPGKEWKYLWSWNGPDTDGGATEHTYHQPDPYKAWEARTVTGAAFVFVPANDKGIFALNKTDGKPAWNFDKAKFNSTPAFDPKTKSLLAGADDGKLYKFDAATGKVLASFDAGSPIRKSVLLVGPSAYAVTDAGDLHKIDISSMKKTWTYSAGAEGQTPPAYSSARKSIVFCSGDLNVHCVSDADGKLKWKAKPSPNEPGDPVVFTGCTPVVAEKHGIVFVRLIPGDVGFILGSGPGGSGKWPKTNADIKKHLAANPQFKNLFALDLESGKERFTPAVGPGGVEDLLAGGKGGPVLRLHRMPVIKILPDGSEVAYLSFRNGDTKDPKWDGRWDSHPGEMVLDDKTIPGLSAGDCRFISWDSSQVRLTDEECPFTMAANTLFNAHWGGSESTIINDRGPAKGLTRDDGISTKPNPAVIRRMNPGGPKDTATRWTTSYLSLFKDGRGFGQRGWWVYWGVMDPPNPERGAYSEGILPRYTYVADGLVVTEGNGGELFVLSCAKPASAAAAPEKKK